MTTPAMSRITVRVEHADSGHVHVAIWMMGALTGRLVMTVAEFHRFDEVLQKGYGIQYVLENAAKFADVVLDLTPSIVCPQCHKRSWNPNDVAQRYCGNCHQFHDLMRLAQERPIP